ncbi:MAG: hypothetical protein LIO93_10080 [Bacteroidales bacterium]|nr:hypothetical protein [Bacteroidales bacterium]
MKEDVTNRIILDLSDIEANTSKISFVEDEVGKLKKEVEKTNDLLTDLYSLLLEIRDKK